MIDVSGPDVEVFLLVVVVTVTPDEAGIPQIEQGQRDQDPPPAPLPNASKPCLPHGSSPVENQVRYRTMWPPWARTASATPTGRKNEGPGARRQPLLLTMCVSLEAIILSVFVLLSQNRQVARDRTRNDIEYRVNLKAELEIAHLHEKFDEMNAEVLERLKVLERRHAR